MIAKRTFWLLILALSLVLAACGGDEATTVEETAVSESAAVEAPPLDASALPLEIDVNTAAFIKDQDDVFMLDVREQWEYDEAHIPGVTLIPMGEVSDRLSELPKDQEIILTCRSGNRSGQVTSFLQQQGFTNVHNMQGGILAWQAAGYDVE